MTRISRNAQLIYLVVRNLRGEITYQTDVTSLMPEQRQEMLREIRGTLPLGNGAEIEKTH